MKEPKISSWQGGIAEKGPVGKKYYCSSNLSKLKEGHEVDSLSTQHPQDLRDFKKVEKEWSFGN